MNSKMRRGGAIAGWTALAVWLLALAGSPAANARARPAAKTGPSAARPDAAVRPRSPGTLYAVVLGPGPAWKRGQPLRRSASEGHFRYWQDLYRQGRVESAGPVGKDTGFALLRARSQREANTVLAADPAVRSGQFRAVARPYDPAFSAGG